MTSPSACRDEVAARTSSRLPSKGERMSFAHPGAFALNTPSPCYGPSARSHRAGLSWGRPEHGDVSDTVISFISFILIRTRRVCTRRWISSQTTNSREAGASSRNVRCQEETSPAGFGSESALPH
jgi:hypothetical protein